MGGVSASVIAPHQELADVRSFGDAAQLFEKMEAAVAARVDEQRRHDAKLLQLANAEKEALRQEVERERERAERTRQETQAEMERLREASRPRTAEEACSDEQLEAVQSRLQALHTAELLTDAELHAAEDVIVDCIEVRAKTPGAPAAVQAVDQALTMVVLSERLASDAAFARQLRRKLRL